MNLYFRLFLMFLRARWRRRISILDQYESRHLVWPNDLDLLGHMNNGRYFTVTDLVRIEMLIRAGVWQVMRKRGLYPVMAGESIQFRKSLKPFQRYTIHSKSLGWDERFIYVEHQFESKGTVYALALVKVRIVGQGRPMPVDVLRELYPDLPTVQMDAVIDKWNGSTDGHWSAHQRAA